MDPEFDLRDNKYGYLNGLLHEYESDDEIDPMYVSYNDSVCFNTDFIAETKRNFVGRECHNYRELNEPTLLVA